MTGTHVFNGTAGARQDSTHTLKVIHGIVNAVSWGILLPTGAAIGQYLRHIKLFGPAWFYAHAGTQLFTFFLGTVGSQTGRRLGELSPGAAYVTHRKLGFAVFSLGANQTMALLFQPKTSHVFRTYWK
ncbi:hypothetical protein MLD38_019932 [Melastoma candidum]|uniref:Uncharacterized protein n=1 Tax=Melastoma candidum TaxID=119954 RepID=A0ACB9QEA8_9MYRT|nr:hypothetical protein MLD38_019932 [Melastoma candidum]